MTLTEVKKSFTMKWDPSKIINPLEKTANFCDEPDDYIEGNNSGENSKNNPYFNLFHGQVKSSRAEGMSQNSDECLIKLSNVWKIYQMGEGEFAALKGIDLEIVRYATRVVYIRDGLIEKVDIRKKNEKGE